MGIALQLEKKNVTKELYQNIEVLKRYQSDKTDEAQNLLDIAISQKYAKYMPFVSVAKYCNLSMNQTLSYVTKVLDGINQTTIKNNYDTIPLFHKKISLSLKP